MYGFHNRALAELPHWSCALKGLYWVVRVEGRNASKKRNAYRAIRKERLRLVEAGICIYQVNAVCKYLVSLKQVNADRLHVIFSSDNKQLRLNFDTDAI